MREEQLELLKRILAWSKRKGDCVVCYTNLSEHGVPRTRYLGKKYKTHRLIMFLMGQLDLNDSKSLVLHAIECKSRACIEFNHLRIGTQSDNVYDSIKKGTHVVFGKR